LTGEYALQHDTSVADATHATLMLQFM